MRQQAKIGKCSLGFYCHRVRVVESLVYHWCRETADVALDALMCYKLCGLPHNLTHKLTLCGATFVCPPHCVAKLRWFGRLIFRWYDLSCVDFADTQHADSIEYQYWHSYCDPWTFPDRKYFCVFTDHQTPVYAIIGYHAAVMLCELIEIVFRICDSKCFQ